MKAFGWTIEEVASLTVPQFRWLREELIKMQEDEQREMKKRERKAMGALRR